MVRINEKGERQEGDTDIQKEGRQEKRKCNRQEGKKAEENEPIMEASSQLCSHQLEYYSIISVAVRKFPDKKQLKGENICFALQSQAVVRHCVEVRDLGRSLEISSTVKSRGTQMSSGSLACFCAAWFFDCTIQFPIPRQQ